MSRAIYIFFWLVVSSGFLWADNTTTNPDDISSVIRGQAEKRKFDYFFYEGLNQKLAGKYDAAFDLFNHCLAIDSTASAVLYELAFFNMQLNRPEKAVDMLRKAVQYTPDNFNYRMTLASISRSIGLFGEAADEYKKLTERYPDKTELNFYLGEALSQEGNIAEAIEAYDQLESAMGMNEALSQQKYRLYMELGQKEEAFKEIEKLAEKYPTVARYPLLLGDLHLENKELDKAYEYYQKAHAIEPANPYYIVSMSNYYEAKGDKEAAEQQIRSALVNEELDVELKVNILSRYIARLQQTKQDMASVNVLFEELIEQHPEDIDLKLMYGSFLSTAQDKQEEARFQFQLVTEMEPDNQAAWQQLLNLALKAEDLPEVIRICQTCMGLFPEAPEYYFYLGIAYYQQEEYQKALDTYQAGVAIIPDENGMLKSDFYGQMGDIYYQIKKMDEAYASYDEALKHNPKNIVVLNNYAYFLSLDKKDLDKAERMSAVTIDMEPNNSTYLDTYAWIFFVKGEYALAKIYIEKALSNDKTNSSELVDHYGDILFMRGDKVKAVEQWKKAKELGKESEVLDRKIAEEKYIEENADNKE